MSKVSEPPANDASHWREYEQNVLSHSMAHYLMAIKSLRATQGYARATDVAEMLEVSRGATSMALAQLRKRGWISEDRHRFLLLTTEGKRMARLVEQNFAILSQFFEEVLGVEQDVAFADACKMEHLMSMETGRRLMGLMRFLLSDQKLAGKMRQAVKSMRDVYKEKGGAGPEA